MLALLKALSYSWCPMEGALPAAPCSLPTRPSACSSSHLPANSRLTPSLLTPSLGKALPEVLNPNRAFWGRGKRR